MSETVFHKILRGEIPARIIYEDESVFAIRDIHPVADTHILVIPKKTIPRVTALTHDDEIIVGHMVTVAKELADDEGVSQTGFRLVMNCGENGGQTVEQLHLHLIGGRQFAWPPG